MKRFSFSLDDVRFAAALGVLVAVAVFAYVFLDTMHDLVEEAAEPVPEHSAPTVDELAALGRHEALEQQSESSAAPHAQPRTAKEKTAHE